MASTDARPVPIKNTAFRAYFDLRLNTGALNSGAAGLDSEVSKDAGTMTDCTNEATEIASSSGHYYLDLTSTEMNADSVVVQIKSSTTNAVTRTLIIYPQETGDIKADVQSWNGTTVATPNTAGVPLVDVTRWLGTTVATPNTAGVPLIDVARWLGTVVVTPNTNGVPVVDTREIARQGTAQAGASGSITLDASASATDQFYVPCRVRIIAGTGAGQSRVGLGYTGSTKVLTVAPNWTTNPSTDSVFQLTPSAVDVESWLKVAPLALSSQYVQAKADLVTWLGAAPAALTSQLVQTSVAAMQADTVTANAVAADAIGSSELAASAATEIANAVGALVAEAQGSRTVLQCLSVILSLVAGRSSVSGGTATFSTADGVATRAVLTYSGSDRTGSTLSP